MLKSYLKKTIVILDFKYKYELKYVNFYLYIGDRCV